MSDPFTRIAEEWDETPEEMAERWDREYPPKPAPIMGPSERKNALVVFPLQVFGNVRLQAERRNYLVKGLLANTGLAVIWGRQNAANRFGPQTLACISRLAGNTAATGYSRLL